MCAPAMLAPAGTPIRAPEKVQTSVSLLPGHQRVYPAQRVHFKCHYNHGSESHNYMVWFVELNSIVAL